MLKYVRIAVTTYSLTACVLLVALLVWSYCREDGLEWLMMFAVPFWWLAAICAAANFVFVAAIAIEGIALGQFRFSLRTLLIGTTLVAVGLGIVAMMSR
jgi:hypothetical protein